MAFIDIGATGELIGGLAALLTLVYLAFQILENVKALRLQSSQDFRRLTGAAEIAFMGVTTHEAYDKAIHRPLELSRS